MQSIRRITQGQNQRKELVKAIDSVDAPNLEDNSMDPADLEELAAFFFRSQLAGGVQANVYTVQSILQGVYAGAILYIEDLTLRLGPGPQDQLADGMQANVYCTSSGSSHAHGQLASSVQPQVAQVASDQPRCPLGPAPDLQVPPTPSPLKIGPPPTYTNLRPKGPPMALRESAKSAGLLCMQRCACRRTSCTRGRYHTPGFHLFPENHGLPRCQQPGPVNTKDKMEVVSQGTTASKRVVETTPLPGSSSSSCPAATPV